jgi:hypothetical protein
MGISNILEVGIFKIDRQLGKRFFGGLRYRIYVQSHEV